MLDAKSNVTTLSIASPFVLGERTGHAVLSSCFPRAQTLLGRDRRTRAIPCEVRGATVRVLVLVRIVPKLISSSTPFPANIWHGGDPRPTTHGVMQPHTSYQPRRGAPKARREAWMRRTRTLRILSPRLWLCGNQAKAFDDGTKFVFLLFPLAFRCHHVERVQHISPDRIDGIVVPLPTGCFHHIFHGVIELSRTIRAFLRIQQGRSFLRPWRCDALVQQRMGSLFWCAHRIPLESRRHGRHDHAHVHFSVGAWWSKTSHRFALSLVLPRSCIQRSRIELGHAICRHDVQRAICKPIHGIQELVSSCSVVATLLSTHRIHAIELGSVRPRRRQLLQRPRRASAEVSAQRHRRGDECAAQDPPARRLRLGPGVGIASVAVATHRLPPARVRAPPPAHGGPSTRRSHRRTRRRDDAVALGATRWAAFGRDEHVDDGGSGAKDVEEPSHHPGMDKQWMVGGTMHGCMDRLLAPCKESVRWERRNGWHQTGKSRTQDSGGG
mmetsp:Transcript_10555/g.64855  ORF Transcript_10555/g.64855 Transcript_10555/m.64855 type:complete len:497 (-) Transcript_10555:2673-4163(-)